MIPWTDYECRLALDELYRGDKVIIPRDESIAPAIAKLIPPSCDKAILREVTICLIAEISRLITESTPSSAKVGWCSLANT